MTADMKPKDKDLSPESNEMIEGKREDHHGDKQTRRSRVVVESCWRTGIITAQPLLTVNGDGQ